MRRKRSRDGLSVRAISGTYVVMLGINMEEADCTGLRGFAIHRTDHTEDEAYWMRDIKTFEETDPHRHRPASAGLAAGGNDGGLQPATKDRRLGLLRQAGDGGE